MKKAIRIAEKGRGFTSPNPLVGSLIIDTEGNVIGEGYHQHYGGSHAEINALKSLKTSVKNAEILSTLEPCTHYGKTGPCTKAIIESGVKKVIIGALDPNPLVSGKGIRELMDYGISVEQGICSDEIFEQNESYVKYVTTGLPLVTLKIAINKDGKIAARSGGRTRLTGDKANYFTHTLRSKADAVVSGIGTVLADDPLLNVRLLKTKRQPARIILDSMARTPLDGKLAGTASEIKTIIATSKDADKHKIDLLRKNGFEILYLEREKNQNMLSLEKLLVSLAGVGHINLLIEGGKTLSSSFIKQGLVDKIELLVSGKVLGRTALDAFDEEAKKIIDERFVIEKKELLGADERISGRII